MIIPFFSSEAATVSILIFTCVAAALVLKHRGWLSNKHLWWGSAGLLCVVPLLVLTGFWPNGQWGISDWDYYFSYHTAVRRMVVEQGVFPQWNPYICGGTSAIGDPEFPLFAPTFLLELLFGVPTGLRAAIFTMVSFGGIGILLLAKRLKLSPAAGLLAAIAFSLSSVTLLEIVEGHPNVFSAFYLPWIFWSWLGAYEAGSTFAKASAHTLWALLCGVFLALTFFHGGIYMLMYVGLAFLFLIVTLPRKRQALWVSTTAAGWALGLAAIKLVPVLWWLRQFQDTAYASSTYLLPSLHKILLGRYPHGSENIVPNQGGGWHEYGAYIGIIVLLLSLLSLLKIRQSHIRLLWLGALMAILIASSGPLLKPLFDQVSFLPRSNISRIIILAILPLSLLAGYGLQTIKLPRRLIAIATALLIAAVTFDLAGYAAALSEQAFILAPAPRMTPALEPIAYTIDTHTVRVQGVDWTRAYAGAVAGYGTLSYCSVLSPEPAVRVVEDPEGSPYLTVSGNNGRAELISWSPHKVQIRAIFEEPGEVVLNSNYARGWWVNDVPAREVNGRLAAVSIPPGNHILTFEYRVPGFTGGLIITLVTIAGALAYGGYSYLKTRRS